FGEFSGGTFLINGQPFKLPVEPVLRLIAIGVALVVAGITAIGMSNAWPTLALFLYAGSIPQSATSAVDPTFNPPVTFYLFTLPAWQLIAGWLTTMAVIVLVAAIFFALVTGGGRLLSGRIAASTTFPALRGVSVAFAFVLLMLAVQVYLGRFDRLLAE